MKISHQACHVTQYALFALISLLSSCLFAREVTLSTGEYPPWTKEKSTYGGYVNRVITEAFRRQGLTVTFNYMPWRRSKEEALSGRVDGSSFWFKSADKKADFLQSDVFSTHRELLFHLKSTTIPDWERITDLAAYKFGATRGYTYTRAFWEAGKANKIVIEEATSDMLNLRKLLKGRIQVFPLAETTGWYLLRNEFDRGIGDIVTTHAKPLTTNEGVVLFSKKRKGTAALRDAFNRSLGEMKKDGTLDQYYSDMLKGIY